MTINVRTPEEFAEGHSEGAVNIDLNSPDFPQMIATLDQSGTYAVYCRSGNRSAKAAQFMADNNFANVTNLGSVEEAAQALNLAVIQ